MQRRGLLAGAVALGGSALLGACRSQAHNSAHIIGDFVGTHAERGHVLRGGEPLASPSVYRRTDVLIAGGGVAGLAAARALRQHGVEDFALLELEDSAGGNSRAGSVGGIACPLGAHYLPLPGDDAWEVQDLLEELGLRQRVSGRWQYDERHLCHSPQERVFFQGEWQMGLLPVHGVGAATLAQYQKFATLVAHWRQKTPWHLPASRTPLAPEVAGLVAVSFEAFLNQNSLTDPHLRWYLNYCCRDDYGAGIATVSAWAGIHYFASRHGFTAPGMDSGEHEGLLTWPQGNAWLTQRLAAPLGERLHTGQVVLRIAQQKHGVEVDTLDVATQTVQRWQARRAIVALPIFIAARVVLDPPDWLREAAQHIRYAPWLVANLHISAPLHDRPGAPPSWDNVLYDDKPDATALGYVDAQHQSLRSVPGATVLSSYRALGDKPGARAELLQHPWTHWRDMVLSEMAVAHPDLAAKTTRIDITRYGHAMAIPMPRQRGQIGFQPPADRGSQRSQKHPPRIQHDKLRFAHSDWAGYSIFEEAFTLGHHAA